MENLTLIHIPTEVICLTKLLQIKVLPKKILKESLDRFYLEREAFEETVSELSDKLEECKFEICEQFSENNYNKKPTKMLSLKNLGLKLIQVR